MPVDVTASSGLSGEIDLSWSPPPVNPAVATLPEKYRVQRAFDPAGEFNDIFTTANAAQTTYQDQALPGNARYAYRIVALDNSARPGPPSTPVLGTTAVTAINDLAASGTAPGGGIMLAWSFVAGANAYQVLSGAPGGPYTLVSTLTGLVHGYAAQPLRAGESSRAFVIRSRTGTTWGGYSNEAVFATPAPHSPAATAASGGKVTTPPAPTSVTGTRLASGAALRVLLVDHDCSHNNTDKTSIDLSASDQCFRALAQNLVGKRDGTIEIEVVPLGENGPNLARLREFDVVLWYTGDVYGGAHDNSALLSVEDEKSVTNYAKRGGAFLLFSPGFATSLWADASWSDTKHPFLRDIIGARGVTGLAKRFQPGTVTATGGGVFHVLGGQATETQFSAINPQAAQPVFTSVLNPAAKNAPAQAVAVANSIGSGHMIYVGFSFENIEPTERAAAFNTLLRAGGLVGTK
jgi:hypothetical protein